MATTLTDEQLANLRRRVEECRNQPDARMHPRFGWREVEMLLNVAERQIQNERACTRGEAEKRPELEDRIRNLELSVNDLRSVVRKLSWGMNDGLK